MKRLSPAVACALVIVSATAAFPQIQFYPSKTVTIVVPVSSGSVTDTIARMLAESLRTRWSRVVLVENRPGIPGALSVARAPADGYTLLLNSNGQTVLGSFAKTPGFDPVNEFTGIAQIASAPLILLATPSLPVTDLKGFIDLARSKPRELNIALPGVGTSASILSELFLCEAGIDVLGIPFKGAPEAMNSVLQGDGHVFFAFSSIGMPMIQAGKVRALAVTTPHRLAALPNVPTLQEAGLPNFAYDAWFGILAPAKINDGLRTKLSRDVLSVVKTPEFRSRLEQQGLELVVQDSDSFDAIIRRDANRFAPLFKSYGESGSNDRTDRTRSCAVR